MKRNTLRLVIILAILAIVGVTITQGLWFLRAFDIKDKQFNQTVNIALRQVAEDILKYNENFALPSNPVSQPGSNYFVVMVNDVIDANVLELLLKREFERRSILSDFEYGIYDCNSGNMVYGNYVSMVNRGGEERVGSVLPRWDRENYYFVVHFPDKEANLIGQMGIWIFSTVVMLLVIVFFTYTLFVILRQKRLSEVQNDFVNNMTHEFKTPVSTIALSAEVLKSPEITSTPERLLTYATIIGNEAQRLKNQVERVLQMAVMGSDLVNLKRELVDVHKLIDQATDQSKLALERANGRLTTDLSAKRFMINADPLHLSNCLFNLLDNAIKYSTEAPEINISTGNENSDILIQVADSGLGIPKEHQKRVFEKFYRVSTGFRHDVKGFGLGLHYVGEMIKAHGGSIALSSEVGKGCVFTIRLHLA